MRSIPRVRKYSLTSNKSFFPFLHGLHQLKSSLECLSRSVTLPVACACGSFVELFCAIPCFSLVTLSTGVVVWSSSAVAAAGGGKAAAAAAPSLARSLSRSRLHLQCWVLQLRQHRKRDPLQRRDHEERQRVRGRRKQEEEGRVTNRRRRLRKHGGKIQRSRQR